MELAPFATADICHFDASEAMQECRGDAPCNRVAATRVAQGSMR